MRFSQKGSEVEKSSVLYMKVSFKFESPGKHHPDTGLVKHSRFDSPPHRASTYLGCSLVGSTPRMTRDRMVFHVYSRSTPAGSQHILYSHHIHFYIFPPWHSSKSCLSVSYHSCFIIYSCIAQTPLQSQFSFSWIIYTRSRNHKTVKYRLNSSSELRGKNIP